MLFNSYNYLFFLLIVFILFWLVAKDKSKLQTWILLLSSYVFYACWDWRFLFLIIISSSIDFYCGLMMKQSNNKKLLLTISIVSNLSILFFFKYFNFFIESFHNLVGNSSESFSTLNIILPIGISFYTFQTLSYTIDVYQEKLAPTKSPLIFFTFVAFFPQLVAGPIERARKLLPQLTNLKKFCEIKAISGVEQIIWGLFKKVVIADNLGLIVEKLFDNPEAMNSSALILGCIFFSFQIYGDFSGYSDMAIGTAKLFNIELMINFKKPYFSRDLGEFWRRWHISLSTWFRDYIYIPLGGNQNGTLDTTKNILIVFILSGLWHGADSKFIFWGLLHSIYFLPLIIFNRHKKYHSKKNDDKYTVFDFIKIFFTFLLVSISWIPFRAESLNDAMFYFQNIFSNFNSGEDIIQTEVCLALLLFVIIEWFSKENEYPLQGVKKPILKFLCFFIIITLIFDFGIGTKEFIYFQF